MKKLIAMLLALVLVLAMAGCEKDEGCDHEWAAATCETPKTCELCDETKGEALGHSWVDATCDAPKTCETCKATEGEALGHNWEEATTETPKTCTTCQATEGEKLQAGDSRFTTASTRDLQGVWNADVTFTGEMMGTAGLIDKLDCVMTYEFGNTGILKVSVAVKDEAAFKEEMTTAMINLLYSEFEAQGLSKEAANEAMVAAYGMTTEEYAASAVDEMDVAELLGDANTEAVYYVENGKLYRADSWNGDFEESDFTLENGVLTIATDVMEEGGEPLKWTRVN